MKRLTTAVILAALGLRLIAGQTSDDAWLENRCEWRIPLTVSENNGLARRGLPVVINADAILEKSGAAAIRCDSLCLFDDAGRLVPLQVDEKDDTGFYQPQANGSLDADDELIFAATLTANASARYCLYFSVNGGCNSLESRGSIRFEKGNAVGGRSFDCNAILSNDCLLVGIHGADEGQPSAAGSSRGCVTRLAWHGQELLRSRQEGLFWGPHQSRAAWSEPILAADGPLRTTVQLQSVPAKLQFQRNDGSWAVNKSAIGNLDGFIVRAFSLYAGLPYIEFQEFYRPQQKSTAINASFICSFRTMPLSPLERQDILYGPWQGMIHTVRLEDESFFETPYPSDGWLALLSQKGKTGLALFFETARARLVHGFVIRDYLRAKTLGKAGDERMSSDFQVTSRIENLQPQKTYVNRFGLWLLDGQEAAEIRGLYAQYWASPPRIDWGDPQPAATATGKKE